MATPSLRRPYVLIVEYTACSLNNVREKVPCIYLNHPTTIFSLSPV